MKRLVVARPSAEGTRALGTVRINGGNVKHDLDDDAVGSIVDNFDGATRLAGGQPGSTSLDYDYRTAGEVEEQMPDDDVAQLLRTTLRSEGLLVTTPEKAPQDWQEGR